MRYGCVSQRAERMRSMLYGNRPSCQKIERGKALLRLRLPLSKFFLFFFVDVIRRMHVTSFGWNPRAADSAVLIIMDRSYYGPYIAGETGFIPHRDELSIYYSP